MVILAFYNLYIAPSPQTELKPPSKLAMISIPYFPNVIASFIFSTSGKIPWEVFLSFWYTYRLLFLKKLVGSSKLVAFCKIIFSYVSYNAR